jgi:transposase
MLNIRRIIQLKTEGANKSQIARKLKLHRATLNTYLARLAATGKPLESLLDWSDEALAQVVYQEEHTNQPDARLLELQELLPSYLKQLDAVGLTRLLLWQEYRTTHLDGYSYTQFCEHLSRYKEIRKATMRIEHQPGWLLQVDFAGKNLSYCDRVTGEVIECPVLVCILPYSGYAYVEALSSARQEPLFNALGRCLEYLGGVPRTIVSDNMKQYVIKNNRYEFTFSELVNQWALHYHTDLEATRPRKPKDKPSVENGVWHAYLRIYARLRHEEFDSLSALNRRIRELLDEHNAKPFQKRPGSRRSCFVEEELPHLRALPAEPFTILHRTTAKVQRNHHVILGEDAHEYSVPYQYIGYQTSLVYSEHTVEVFVDRRRIATHPRNRRRHGYSTLHEHRPTNHQAWIDSLGWDGHAFEAFGSKIGPYASEAFQQVMLSKEFIEQTYKACMGLKRLAKLYGNERFEAACQRALLGGKVTYGLLNQILKNNLDRQEHIQENLFTTPRHQNIRGKHAYQ